MGSSPRSTSVTGCLEMITSNWKEEKDRIIVKKIYIYNRQTTINTEIARKNKYVQQ